MKIVEKEDLESGGKVHAQPVSKSKIPKRNGKSEAWEQKRMEMVTHLR